MKTKSIVQTAFALLCIALLYTTTNAQWVNDGGVKGKTVSDTTGDQTNIKVISDGSGVVTFWLDSRNGNSYIYAQKINSTGNEVWKHNGDTVYYAGTITKNFDVVKSGADFLTGYIADGDNQPDAMRVQKTSGSNADYLWIIYGKLVVDLSATNNLGKELNLKMAPDGSDGAIIVWEDYRNYNTTGIDIYAQRIDVNGNALWTANGISVTNAAGAQTKPQVITFGDGSCLIAWEDMRNINKEIYVQRLYSNGTKVYTDIAGNNGFNFNVSGGYSEFIDDQENFKMIGQGGTAILTWQDKRKIDEYDIYAARIDSGKVGIFGGYAPAVSWVTPVCQSLHDQVDPAINWDGSGGVVITWTDLRNDGDYDIYAQRINGSGTPQWTTDGVAVCTAIFNQERPQIVNVGGGEYVVAWQDNRGGTNYDIFANKISGTGTTSAGTSGVVVSGRRNNQWNPQVVPSDNGSAIFVWEDYRNFEITGTDIYAHKLLSNNFTLPVQIAKFGATVKDGVVTLSWETITESNNNGFIAERATLGKNGFFGGFPKAENFRKISPTIAGQGTINFPHYYSYVDKQATMGTNWYRLQQIDNDGKVTYFDPIKVEVGLPTTTSLDQNYPNPFNPNTVISYRLPEKTFTTLKVYNVLGETVATLVNGEQEGGTYMATLNATTLPTGVYYYRLQAGNFVETKKMMLVK